MQLPATVSLLIAQLRKTCCCSYNYCCCITALLIDLLHTHTASRSICSVCSVCSVGGDWWSCANACLLTIALLRSAPLANYTISIFIYLPLLLLLLLLVLPAHCCLFFFRFFLRFVLLLHRHKFVLCFAVVCAISLCCCWRCCCCRCCCCCVCCCCCIFASCVPLLLSNASLFTFACVLWLLLCLQLFSNCTFRHLLLLLQLLSTLLTQTHIFHISNNMQLALFLLHSLVAETHAQRERESKSDNERAHWRPEL